jgi:hypothetical protein
VHRRRVTAFLARSAFQRGVKFPDWRVSRGPADGVERQARPGLAAAPMTAREIANALVADKAPQATRRQAIDLQGPLFLSPFGSARERQRGGD